MIVDIYRITEILSLIIREFIDWIIYYSYFNVRL